MYKPYPASTKPLYVYNQKYDNKKKPEKETYRFHGAFVAPQGQKKKINSKLFYEDDHPISHLTQLPPS